MQLQVKQIYNPRFIAPNEIRTANISRRQNLTNFYDNDEKINDFWILINPKILRGVKRLNNSPYSPKEFFLEFFNRVRVKNFIKNFIASGIKN